MTKDNELFVSMPVGKAVTKLAVPTVISQIIVILYSMADTFFIGKTDDPNWTVRLKNKTFWLALIPAVLLLVQVIAAVFGYQLDLGDLGNKLLDVVNALFAVLAILGIVTDPTTAGVKDSEQAMTYTEPKK